MKRFSTLSRVLVLCNLVRIEARMSLKEFQYPQSGISPLQPDRTPPAAWLLVWVSVPSVGY